MCRCDGGDTEDARATSYRFLHFPANPPPRKRIDL